MKKIYISFLIGYIINIFIKISGIKFLGLILALTEIIFLFYVFRKKGIQNEHEEKLFLKKFHIGLYTLVVATWITDWILDLLMS